MNEIIANYSKLVIGACALIVTIGYVTGHVSMADLQVLIGLGLGLHAGTSGLSSIIGGPTSNAEITETNVTKAVRGANG